MTVWEKPPGLDEVTDRAWMNFCAAPRNYSVVLSRKQLRSFLLQTGGQIHAYGKPWDITSVSIGPGVYRVTAREEH